MPGGCSDLLSPRSVEQSAGVYKSTDGGVSWHETGSFPQTVGNFYGFRLVQSPEDPDLLMAATSDGLYRTTDGGDNWTQEVSGLFWDVKFKPGDGTRAYAAKGGHEFYISDRANWKR